jgi:NAD kinase
MYQIFAMWQMISPAGHAALTLRSRLRCIIMRKNDELSKTSKPPTNLLVLNEVVIDRGPSPYLSNIDLFLDGKHITSVQGDGESRVFDLIYSGNCHPCILEMTLS